MRSAVTSIFLLALAGCAAVDPYASDPIASHLRRDDDVGYCARLFADIDRRVDALEVRDAEAPRIDGFPYLRVDRESAAMVPQAAVAGPARQAWLARLATLDDAGRMAELANAALPSDDLDRCRALLAVADAGSIDDLRTRARVPDAYSTPTRVIGLYPLTRLGFAAGIANWHEDTRAVFSTPLAQLPVRGRLTRFGVRMVSPIAEVALPAGNDALGVPSLSRFDQTALLLRHAPILEIDVQGSHDQPGTMTLDVEDRPAVDAGQATAYTRVAHALFDDGAHVQLVYTFWFSERPARDALDPLSGRIDGLIWRVTLDRDGVPLVYDTIHACGCYHLFFPTERVVARPQRDSLDEGPFSPQGLSAPKRDEMVVLRIQTGTHDLQRVSIEPRADPAARYQLDDDRRLTSLPRASGGTRSAYGTDGLMPGTERGERWLFWATGIDSVGQMRQWGHHATAFVGRRHFDDPELLGSYFTRRAASSAPTAP